ncbi:hypothetical protein NQ315_017463 [Exocentrus adspersus]|uniref:Uncharacterized protein n=1 Tax=Exocentrus adspersus TaxID=1586481 RepID=A0AAV8VLC7_9CUCU|nr:hypothetical protein NQ315_017463 [Exocentrus adspersus]
MYKIQTNLYVYSHIVYKKEVAIQEVKAKENIPYVEAKRKVNSTTPIPHVSDAKLWLPLLKLITLPSLNS